MKIFYKIGVTVALVIICCDIYAQEGGAMDSSINRRQQLQVAETVKKMTKDLKLTTGQEKALINLYTDFNTKLDQARALYNPRVKSKVNFVKPLYNWREKQLERILSKEQFVAYSTRVFLQKTKVKTSKPTTDAKDRKPTVINY